MGDSDAIDREAILARRRRLILAALGGLAGAGACARVEPPTKPPKNFETPAETVPNPEPGVECVADPVADIDRYERAEVFFLRGQRAQEGGDLACALAMFEAAYDEFPGEYRYAFYVGEAAFAVGDCEKALVHFEHYLQYSDGSNPDRDQRARELLSIPEHETCGLAWPPPRPCLSIAPPDRATRKRQK